jgi:hypothetical protein
MAVLGGRPPGPEPDFESFRILQGKREGKSSVFKGLEKPLSVQIKGFEDAPFAAYFTHLQFAKSRRLLAEK